MYTLVLGLVSPEIVVAIGAAAVLIFGIDKLPRLARSAGLAKKEFLVGQIEAEALASKAGGHGHA